jgi:hypothetical protein
VIIIKVSSSACSKASEDFSGGGCESVHSHHQFQANHHPPTIIVTYHHNHRNNLYITVSFLPRTSSTKYTLSNDCRKMTLRDGHGRTPHDTWEQIESTAVMLCCLPCLAVVVCVQSVGVIVKNVRQRWRLKEQGRREEMERNRRVELVAAMSSEKETRSSSTEDESSETKAKDLE